MANLLALAGFTVIRDLRAARPYRMKLLAETTPSPVMIADPLRDARRELLDHAALEEGLQQVQSHSVRARAALANELGSRLAVERMVRKKAKTAAREVLLLTASLILPVARSELWRSPGNA